MRPSILWSHCWFFSQVLSTISIYFVMYSFWLIEQEVFYHRMRSLFLYGSLLAVNFLGQVKTRFDITVTKSITSKWVRRLIGYKYSTFCLFLAQILNKKIRMYSYFRLQWIFNFDIILVHIIILDSDLPNISPIDTFSSKNVNKNPQKQI